MDKRLVWVDWMKTLAMYLIIAGHCNVPGNKYIYVFSVPCFFILSGFLTKKETDVKVFWNKIWWNLILPMGLLFFVNMLFSSFFNVLSGNFNLNYLWQTPLNAILGFQGEDMASGGIGVLWFVYSLIICRIILQFIPVKQEKSWLILLNIAMLIGAFFINKKGIVIFNSFADVLLAMPFFSIGYFIRPYKDKLNNVGLPWLFLVFLVGIVGVCLCGKYNDMVYLYCCSYGNNIVLCFLGALCGTAVVYAISMLFKSQFIHFVEVIGGGTLIILGLHVIVIRLMSLLFRIPDYWLYAKALIILLLFIPVILFVKRYIPVLYGKQRKL